MLRGALRAGCLLLAGTVAAQPPPTLVRVTFPEKLHEVYVYFDQDVQKPSAETVSNYYLSHWASGQQIHIIAVRQWTGIRVRLILAEPILPETRYSLHVQNVRNVIGVPMVPESIDFETPTFILTEGDQGVEDPRLALHLQEAGSGIPPCFVYENEVCESLRTQGGTWQNYWAYLIAIEPGGREMGKGTAGFSEASFGIVYDAPLALGWIGCQSEIPTPDWPANESGMVVRWPGPTGLICEARSHPEESQALVGTFILYAYGDASLQLRGHPTSGLTEVEDCAGGRHVIPAVHRGSVAFGNRTTGYAPCSTVSPIQATTWGGIKRMFRQPGEETGESKPPQ